MMSLSRLKGNDIRFVHYLDNRSTNAVNLTDKMSFAITVLPRGER